LIATLPKLQLLHGKVVTDDTFGNGSFMEISPDGKRALYVANKKSDADGGCILLLFSFCQAPAYHLPLSILFTFSI
jgi:hypothetical protein